ncbi:MAG: hypothetical protein WCB79_01620 [Halobacteriota archaeon]
MRINFRNFAWSSIGTSGRKMVKLKETLESLDLLVITAEYGHGRKAGWILVRAPARDEDHERWTPAGRVSSGASDEQLSVVRTTLRYAIPDQETDRPV